MNETPLTIVGHLAEDPTLRFTPSGAAVCNFRVLSTPRRLDKQANEWKDGETLGMNCSVWREQAENVAESLTRGSHVIVVGRLEARSWEDKETGQKRSVMEMQAEHVGPALAKATAKVTKSQRQSGGGQQPGGWGGQQQAPQSDPWAGQGQAQQQPGEWAGTNNGSDLPPF